LNETATTTTAIADPAGTPETTTDALKTPIALMKSVVQTKNGSAVRRKRGMADRRDSWG
jgi:hypothetical protein